LNLLESFNPVSIDTLNQKNLLTNRQDRKFVFAGERLTLLLERCLKDYDVLEIDGIRNFKYKTVYYDTHDLNMYLEHQRGKQNRCKIRKREYVNSGISFMEIKMKTNKDRTIKHRVMGTALEDAKALIEANTRYALNELLPVFELQYNRITLLHKSKYEKVTIDTELIYAKGNDRIIFDKMIFAEVKTNDAHDINFCSIMKSMGIRNGSLSKYCLGVMSFYPQIKQNNFKLSLKKLLKTAADATNGHIGV